MKLFSNKTNTSPKVPPMPSEAEILDRMVKDVPKYLSGDVIRLEYSPDRSRRLVLLRKQDGTYTGAIEKAVFFDEEDWKYMYTEPEWSMGFWCPTGDGFFTSIYETEEIAMREIKALGSYKAYFLTEEDNF